MTEETPNKKDPETKFLSEPFAAPIDICRSAHFSVPMTKPLLLTCILLSLVAAVFGFLNRGTLATTRMDLESAQGQVASTNEQLLTAQGELKKSKEEATQLGSEKDKLSAEAGETLVELEKAKEALIAAQKQAKELESDGQAKDAKIGELETKLAGAEPQAPPPEAAGDDVDMAGNNARLLELETVNQQLTDQNVSLSAQVAELKRKDGARQNSQMRQGLSGTILAVNQAWNFVVLSLGDRQGVVSNAEMLVQRDGQYLGKIRVTSVEPSTSIADILVRTVPRGLSVMPGDRVIYQAQRD